MFLLFLYIMKLKQGCPVELFPKLLNAHLWVDWYLLHLRLLVDRSDLTKVHELSFRHLQIQNFKFMCKLFFWCNLAEVVQLTFYWQLMWVASKEKMHPVLQVYTGPIAPYLRNFYHYYSFLFWDFWTELFVLCEELLIRCDFFFEELFPFCHF